MSYKKSELTDKAYHYIKKQILEGNLSPGQRLVEEDIQEALGVSRTPIRGAVSALLHEGLLERSSDRAVVVAKPSLVDIVEIYQLREVLEGLAARLATQRMREEEIQKLLAEFEQVKRQSPASREAMLQVGDRLHEVIIENANSYRLTRILSMLREQFYLASRLAIDVSGRVEKSFNEHRAILTAISMRHATLAEELMRKHLAETREDIVKAWTT